MMLEGTALKGMLDPEKDEVTDFFCLGSGSLVCFLCGRNCIFKCSLVQVETPKG
jgi:hypothetical protein